MVACPGWKGSELPALMRPSSVTSAFSAMPAIAVSMDTGAAGSSVNTKRALVSCSFWSFALLHPVAVIATNEVTVDSQAITTRLFFEARRLKIWS